MKNTNIKNILNAKLRNNYYDNISFFILKISLGRKKLKPGEKYFSGSHSW